MADTPTSIKLAQVVGITTSAIISGKLHPLQNLSLEYYFSSLFEALTDPMKARKLGVISHML